MEKEKRKFLRRNLGWIFLKTFALTIGIFPLKFIYFLGSFLGRLGFLFAFTHRRIVLENLSIAFPYLSLKKRKEIAQDSFKFMIQASLELLYFLKHPSLLERVRIEGLEYLVQALEKKRGVIALTAHFGNFPLISLKFASQGYKINVVARPMRDRKTGDYIHQLRTKVGVKTIFSYPRKECVTGIIRALRNNEIVMIQMDQNFGTGGVWVKFFDKLAATPTGPVVLAMRTKAEIVPMYIVREFLGKHLIKIFPSVALDYTKDKDETILINTAKFTKLTEDWIKKYPPLWGWIHRRWKSQPSDEVLKRRYRIQN